MYNRVIIPPTVEPVTLAEAKQHLRVSTSDQDTLISALIQAAREYTELYCGRSLITQTREQKQDRFYNLSWEAKSPLYYGPVQSISKVEYVDTDGATQEVDASVYAADLVREPALIYNAYNQFWPIPRYQENAVTITYQAGYPGLGSPLDLRAGVPRMIRTALLLLVAHFYECREASSDARIQPVPYGIETLLTPFRMSLW